VSRGILARGLILQADSSSTETMYRGQRFELRTLTLDVEVPGQAPYEIRVTPRIPRIVEALPGATLDLCVDPSNPNDLEILGPAGTVDWIRAAAAVPGQTWGPARPAIPTVGTGATPFMGAAPYVIPVARAARRGCAAAFVVLIVMSLALAAVVHLLRGGHEGKGVPAHAPVPHVPPATPEHRSRPGHPH
jgi:hypothetical protein